MTIYEGENNVQFRMYEERFKSLVQGWTKYLSVGASQIHPKVMLAIMIWLMGSIHTAVMSVSYTHLTLPTKRIV